MRLKNFEPLVIVSNALAGGGAEKTMLALHQELITKGINCYLIALNQSIEIENIENIKILSRKWGGDFKSTLGNFLNFKNLVNQINPKTIIVNCELPELYISLLKSYKGRIICVEHTSIPWHKKRILGVFVRLLLKLRKVEWVTVIKGEREIWFNGKAKYIPNPYIGSANFSRGLGINPSLVFIGGLKENKRPDWVIEAGIKNSIPVNIYGDGKLKFNLESKYSNPAWNIKFNGFKSNVWDLIPNNSLIVIPSEFEGDGMVVIEAIISKYPLLLSWNDDFMRFGLDSKHYFKTFNELEFLVEQNKKNNFINLVPDDRFIENLKKQRSLDSIVLDWLSFLEKS
jgi:glycosyltransferase involved in cell wall biosynthesis